MLHVLARSLLYVRGGEEPPVIPLGPLYAVLRLSVYNRGFF
jgi:hypothetical protein